MCCIFLLVGWGGSCTSQTKKKKICEPLWYSVSINTVFVPSYLLHCIFYRFSLLSYFSEIPIRLELLFWFPLQRVIFKVSFILILSRCVFPRLFQTFSSVILVWTFSRYFAETCFRFYSKLYRKHFYNDFLDYFLCLRCKSSIIFHCIIARSVSTLLRG